MLRHLLISTGLGAAFVWWILADMSTTTTIVSGVLLFVTATAVAVVIVRRARRLHSEWEGYLPQTITHDGNFSRRRRGDDPKDIETHLGAGW